MNYEIPLETLDGNAAKLSDYQGKALLVVNVASRCGATPQYAELEALHRRYAERGFAVLGFPCNQFGAQEPGSPEQIRDFCTTNYDVTFPLFAKTDVNGPKRHPLYAELTQTADDEGNSGDIQWNFEKFVIAPNGNVRRFRRKTEADDPKVIEAIEAALPK